MCVSVCVCVYLVPYEAVKEAETTHNFADTKFLRFEPLTHIPIQQKLIDTSLLTPKEVAYIDDYHATVYRLISPRVKGDALEWLERATAPLQV